MHLNSRWFVSFALMGAIATGAADAQEHAPGATSRPAAQSIYLTSPSTLAPFKAGTRYFNADASGALQVRDGDKGVPRTILTAGSFTIVAPSPNGKYLAYATGGSASAAGEIHVRDVQTGQDLSDVLHHARISPAPWSRDEKGFLYVREDSVDGRQRIYFHGIGRAEAADALIFTQFDHPEWRYAARISDDGHYAVFTISYPADAHTRIYFIDLASPARPNFGAPVVKLAQRFDARYEFVDNAGSYFFLQTDRDAPLGRIVLANTDVVRESRWPSIIPETGDTLLYARTAGDQYLVAVYRSASGASVARLYGPEDPSILRNEMRTRMDSLKKARGTDDPDRRSDRRMSPRELMGSGPAIRLEQRADLPIPSGARIVAMNSVAEDAQLFYTIKLTNGTLQSFTYDVTRATSQPYQPNSVGP
ncbi:MAG: hypothetical protein ABI338_08975 [Gemmatimonadaceae bacterium]